MLWRQELHADMGQSLSEIRALLDAFGLRPKKRFGQNFLHDANHLDRILAATDVREGERVLEVGPGTGALSVRLLAAGARLVAVEVDRDLEPVLHQVFEPFGERATLLIADVLSGKHALNPAVLDAMRGWDGSGGPFKLVANLPYNVASPLLANLALADAGSPDGTKNAGVTGSRGLVMALGIVMVQKEVADRLLASPGGKDYGPLGIVIQAAYEVELVSTLGPGCFWPAPKVASAVVRLTRRAVPACGDWAPLPSFAAFVGRLFSRRRKQLGGILRQWAPGQEALGPLEQRDWQDDLPAGIRPQQRPETLSMEQLVALWRWWS